MSDTYIVYQTTNLINNKVYIGVHCTPTPYKFDGYYGSGKYLFRSINKYGKENFKRETLFIYSTLKDAYIKERELVTPKFVKHKDTYNIKTGGRGSESGKNSPRYGKHLSEKWGVVNGTVRCFIKTYTQDLY